MRIGIDIRELEQGTVTGIGRYLSNFLQYLATHQTPHEYILFGNQNTRFKLTAQNFKIKIIPEFITFFWDQFALARGIRQEKIDLFYSPYYKCPLFSRSKLVITIHDLFPLLPQANPLINRIVLKAWFWIMAQRADLIITVSQDSQKKIGQFLNIPIKKIKVAYDSVDSRFKPQPKETARQKIKDKYSLQNEFILYVGNLKPHKNLSRLIQAYSQLPAALKERYQLLICGKKDKFYQSLFDLARTKELEKNIVFADFVQDQDLPYLYSGAAVFVFPSLGEGFGLPPLEAMACATAVVNADIPALAEIAQDAAVLCDPYSTDKMAEAITRVLTDDALRSVMIKKGLIRAGQFLAEDTAKGLLTLFCATQ